MNKKAFTLVELIVSFSLAGVICIFLLQLVLSLKTLYDNSGIKTEILNKQSLISNQINKTFNEKTISSLSNCGEACINVNYIDNTTDVLKIDYSTNTLQFGTFYTTLPEKTYFKNASVDIIYSGVVDNSSDNALLNITIPIESEKIKNENFGLNIVYQFNSNITNIEYVNFLSSDNYIVLKGNTEQVFNSKTAYVEEGYTVYDKNGNVTTGTVEVDNPLTNLPYKTGNYKIKYSLKDSSGNIISQATRSVTITPSTYNITNLVTNGSFEDGMNGWYVWGQTDKMNVVNSYSLFGQYSIQNYHSVQWESLYLSPELDSQMIPAAANHKYYFANWLYTVNPGNGGCYNHYGFIDLSSGIKYYDPFGGHFQTKINEWEKIGTVLTANDMENLYISFNIVDNYGTDALIECYGDGVMVIDLTETFGAGNEPSQEWCDENINWFEGTTTISY